MPNPSGQERSRRRVSEQVADIFISYARANESDAIEVAKQLRALGYSVWRDDALPPHRPYADVIEERLKSSKAVVVLWSTDAVKSEWVRAEADLARQRRTLVQAALDEATLPLPFNQIQCADLRGWRQGGQHGWSMVEASLSELLCGRESPPEPRASATVTPAPERIRIAVALQPVAMVSGRDPQGLASGLTAELIKAMSCLPGLRVLLTQGPRDQAPNYHLEGSLQRAGERLRLTASLATPDRSLIWSERYDGALKDVFAFQERAATYVASNVDTLIRTLEIEKASGEAPETLDVRQLYYRAIGGLRRMERQSLQDGALCIERLIGLAPDHGHALAVAACIYLNIWMLGVGDTDAETIRKVASDRASRAMRLSDTDHWIAGLSAMVLAWTGHQIDVSLAELNRVCKMAPGFAMGWFWSGMTNARAGESATAIKHYERAIELESLTPQRSTVTGYLGTSRVMDGDFAGALPLLTEALRIRPGWTSLHIFSAIALSHLRRIDEARHALATAEMFAPIAEARWPTRDLRQQALLCDGLSKAGFEYPEQIFADV